jgi:transcriptional regulator with XRE-family HTH domain
MARHRKPTSRGAETFRQRLAHRLRELREKRGLTQVDQARACGLSHVFYGTVERAERSVSLESLELLARGHGLEPWQLVRLDVRDAEAKPVERMAQRIVGLARGASQEKLAQFERLAKVFFEDV